MDPCPWPSTQVEPGHLTSQHNRNISLLHNFADILIDHNYPPFSDRESSAETVQPVMSIMLSSLSATVANPTLTTGSCATSGEPAGVTRATSS